MANLKRATAIIFDDDKLIVFRRVKHGHEYYAFPGGSVEEGETEEEALIREVQEELCLTAESYRSLGVVNNAYYAGNIDAVCFLVDKWTGTPQLGGPELERHREGNEYHIERKTIAELERIENVFPLGVLEVIQREV